MIATTVPLTGLLRVLGDPTRLRMLGLLEREELSVGELSRALGLAQSRVSNHLRVLREAGLLVERHAGKSTFLRHGALETADASPFAAQLWSTLRGQLASLPEHAADLVRLERLLAERDRAGADFFDRVAGEWDKIGVDFETGQARQRAAAALLPREIVVADLGSGTGYMGAALCGLSARVICVDRSRAMLAEAAKRLGRGPHAATVEYRTGELDALPLADREVDGIVAGMVLHHLPHLEPALLEMRRALRPGGRVAVLELAPHRETWMHEELGDRHLGLEPLDVVAAFERAGFESVRFEPVDDRYQPVSPEGGRVFLSLYLVSARAPQDPVLHR